MAHISVATAIQHLLFFFLAVVVPAWDYHDTRRLKQNPSSAGKIRYYKTVCAWLWIASTVACLSVGFGRLFTISPAPGEISWLFEHAWVRYLVGALTALIFTVSLLLPAVIVIWKRLRKLPRKYSSADAMKSLSYFFPATWTERRWFTFACITAGICEETLYRGFLLHYLHIFPCRLGLTLALLVSTVIFALGHLYGGVGGVVGSALGGFLFGLLFLLIGNLSLLMLLHALFDLRALLLLRPPSDELFPRYSP
jgi:CAAX protease family protein